MEDGKTRFVIPPEDSSAISDAVIRFFQEGKAGGFFDNIKKQQYRFSWDHLVDGIEKMTEVGCGVYPRPEAVSLI